MKSAKLRRSFLTKPFIKRSSSIAMSLLLVIVMSVASVPAFVLADVNENLLVHYAFDETSGSIAADSSGNSNNGTIFGTPNFIPGKNGNAIQLDNTDANYVEVPALGSFDSITFAMWIKYSSRTRSYNSLFHSDGWSTGNVHFNVTSSGRLEFAVNGSTQAVQSTTVLPASSSEWIHIAAVYDSINRTRKYFINGKLDAASTSVATALPVLLNTSRIGTWSGGTGSSSRAFNGAFDDFRIYDRALSDSEIAQLAGIEFMMAVDQADTYVFESASEGYASIAAKSFTISNLGSQPTGALAIELSGTSQAAFSLSKTSIANIAVGSTDSFSIQPVDDLPVGNYAGTVTISGANGLSASFGVSFIVKGEGGLLVQYLFENNALDSSGNNFNGTLGSGATFSTNAREGVAALSLPGNANGYCTVPAVTSAASSEFTITTWVNITNLGRTYNSIFSTDGTWTTGSLHYIISGGRIRPCVRANNSANIDVEFSSSASITSTSFGKWMHLALVYDTAGPVKTCSLYINGKLDTINTSSQYAPIRLNTTSRIGGWSAENRGLAGFVDDFRIYDKALSPEEVAALGGVEAHYKFNDNADDSTAHKRHGALNGAASYSTDCIEGSHSLLLNGTSGSFSTSGLGVYGTSTVSTMIKLNSFPTADKYIIGVQSGSGAYNCWISADGKINVSIDGNSSVLSSKYTYTDEDIGKWKIIAITYNYSTRTISLYINGNLDSTEVCTTAAIANFAGAEAGGVTGKAGSTLDGHLDELIFYSVILDADVIEYMAEMSGIDFSGPLEVARAEAPFAAFHTKLAAGNKWENYSRTWDFADIVVQVDGAGGQLIFWRGTSYLPIWKTADGKEYKLTEIVPRTGDGNSIMPDRTNTYSHVQIVENTADKIVIDWKYLPNFRPGNPHQDLNSDNFINELFTITPDGKLTRVIRQGGEEIVDWEDPLNITTQVIQLAPDGFTQISYTLPQHSPAKPPVAGSPIIGTNAITPSLWLSFDEKAGKTTLEKISNKQFEIGVKTVWKNGVSGSALQFDGYASEVVIPAADAPALNGGSITLEGWVALGAYPWNLTPIVQQQSGTTDGYFLGVDGYGYPQLGVRVGTGWQTLTPTHPPFYNNVNRMTLNSWYTGAFTTYDYVNFDRTYELPLFKWSHIVGTYDKDSGEMALYVNGKLAASRTVGTNGVTTTNTDVVVGKNTTPKIPTEVLHDFYATIWGMDGLIDEVKIYNQALTASQVAATFASYNPAISDNPDMDTRSIPDTSTDGSFIAKRTKLKYFETWDNYWREGDYADVVVGFDDNPSRFVFWRGVSYMPCIVNDLDYWFNNECNETWDQYDDEAMSDKWNYSSHVRVIEDTPARKVISWRYRLVGPNQHWAWYNGNTGWGDVAEWLFYIYPDGFASKRMRCYSTNRGHEWNEQMIMTGEGQHPNDIVNQTDCIQLIASDGTATKYSWGNWNSSSPMSIGTAWRSKVGMIINYNGEYKPAILATFLTSGTAGDTYSGERTWYSSYPTWNHWPTALIDVSGRCKLFNDRMGHSSLTHFFTGNYSATATSAAIPYYERLNIEGMTNQTPAELAALYNSWATAPALTNVAGCVSRGYDQPQRAYILDSKDSVNMSFNIGATTARPVDNLCFNIKNWGSDALADVKVNGVSLVESKDFRQGEFIDIDGTYTKIIWVGLSAVTTQSIEITKWASVPIFKDGNDVTIDSLTSETVKVLLPYVNTGVETVSLTMLVGIYNPEGKLVTVVSDTIDDIEPSAHEYFSVVLNLPGNSDGSYAAKGYYAHVFIWDKDTFVPMHDKFTFPSN